MAANEGSYDVAVVGGGCVGASIAAHLGSLAPSMKVCLLERDELGSGATGRSTAVIRGNYSHPELARMARRALDIFPEFRERFGRDVDFRQNGYVAIYSSVDADTAMANVEMQHEVGLHTKIISPKEVADLIPGITGDDIAGGIFEAESGFAEPSMVVDGFAQFARRNGVEIRTGTSVAAVEQYDKGGYVVTTDAGEVHAARVVLATGAWTNGIIAGLGLSLPIDATRHQVVNLVCPPGQAVTTTLADMSLQFYLRPSSPGRCIVGSSRDEDASDFVDPDTYERSSDFEYLEAVANYLAQRFAGWTDAGLSAGYSGVYDVTPDWQPLLGEHPNAPGLIFACGFSGHGFKLSPVVGEAIAQYLIDGEAQHVDLELFRPDRHDLGRPIKPPRSYSGGFSYR